MKPIPFFLIAAYLLTAAACTSTTSLEVLQPAEIFLPEHIETIAIIDRSQPAKGFENVMEGLITGEDIGQDRRGRRRALDGLAMILTRTPRFNVKTTSVEMKGSRTGNSFEPPLLWPEVDEICDRYGADALIAMELYDSDNSVSTDLRKDKKKDKDGNEFVERYYQASIRTQVKVGWRLYDRRERHVLDQFTGIEDATADARGDTEEQAKRNLPAREAITQDVSRAAGELYGMRIAPVWITVNREWYSKGKGDFKDDMQRAARYARAGQWDRAAEIWNTVVATAPDEKNRGRAAYNMAVANEREGKLRQALQWARQAYTDFGNKKARNYIDVIRRRIFEQQQLEEQMEG